MVGTHGSAAWLGLILLCSQQAASGQQPAARPPVWPVPAATANQSANSSIRPMPSASVVPLGEVPGRCREQVRSVISLPTVAGTGPVEQFGGKPELYFWLLDHPDKVSGAWRQLGVGCVDIVNRSDGRYGWSDPHGSDLKWESIYRGPDKHIWYAEGMVNPVPLLPTFPIRAVVVMHHSDEVDAQGQSHIQHHADLFVQTDSKAASMIVRLFGS